MDGTSVKTFSLQQSARELNHTAKMHQITLHCHYIYLVTTH